MKTLSFRNLIVSALILILSLMGLNGYSQGVKLEYKYSNGKSIKYKTTTKIVQDMDVNGQSMLVNIDRYLGCQVKGVGNVGQNVKVEVRVDSLSQNVESPQGSIGGSINDVKGKSFNMVISPAGKLIDNSEGVKVVYNVEGSGEANIGQEFLSYFPGLPSGAVKPGDTWTKTDTVDTKTDANTVWMPVETTYKFEGIEKINGIDCAKITSTQTGSRKMVTKSQGMEIHMAGPFTGTQTLFFAIEGGYFTKFSVSSKMDGNIEIPDQGMSFPVVMNIEATSEME